MSAMSLILAKLIIQPVFAAAFAVPVQEGDRLVLKGLEAQVQLVSIPGSNAVKVVGVDENSSAEGAYVISKKDNIIEVRMNEYDGKKAWMNILPKASSQLRKIEISGLPVPTEIHLRGGSVVAQKWSKDLKVSLTQGRVSSLNGSGNLQVYVQKGDVNVADHTGKVSADTYAGSMSIKNVQGDVDASLFTGPLSLEKVHGFCAITSQIGPAKILQGTGTLQFENGKGGLNIQGFQGRVDGQNQEGSVTVQMAMDSEVDIKSKAGRVQVQAPAGSGASVNLLTIEGDIFVPNELRVNKLSSEKSVRGRLRGEGQRGSIFVRSQDGAIIVK
ncbi:DUF4097 family beta strand repeat-containing protein [Bdellovibrio sp. NC01]|uniref:DUF4097 family beta strand repeat-containing protein n=1 Tax=Bdellovibrio sp. NC01 TaxID=2220073 RepID=UPI001FEDDA84|nr:hypothetical protein [Bdellovibrio sp. NC01]